MAVATVPGAGEVGAGAPGEVKDGAEVEAVGASPEAVAVLEGVAREDGGNMKPKDFINAIPNDTIVSAIGEAESKTSGEIRVFISNREVEDPVKAAQEQFLKLGMERTKHRNGVLLFVAPRSQAFAVIGDAGIHDKCGPEFWSELAGQMAGSFRAGDYSNGILAGVRRAGDLLAKHFPRQSDDQDELSNTVVTD
jgi:uncharacterized membrane protein